MLKKDRPTLALTLPYGQLLQPEQLTTVKICEVSLTADYTQKQLPVPALVLIGPCVEIIYITGRKLSACGPEDHQCSHKINSHPGRREKG